MFAARDIKKQIEKSTLLSNRHVLDGRSANPRQPDGSSGAMHLLQRYLGNSRIQHITEEQQVAERPNIQSEGIQSVPGLQRRYGNRFAQGGVAQHAIQTKLMIGQPGDIYEREADRIAEQIMQMPEPKTQRQLEEEEEEELLQTKSPLTPLWQRGGLRLSTLDGGAREISPELETRINAMRGGGQPLPAFARTFFEPRFGYDFSQVRVHTDEESDALSHSLNAHALTLCKDIFLGQEAHNLGNLSDKKILAHELTHVVQQTHSYQHGRITAWSEGMYKENKGKTVEHAIHVPWVQLQRSPEEEKALETVEGSEWISEKIRIYESRVVSLKKGIDRYQKEAIRAKELRALLGVLGIPFGGLPAHGGFEFFASEAIMYEAQYSKEAKQLEQRKDKYEELIARLKEKQVEKKFEQLMKRIEELEKESGD